MNGSTVFEKFAQSCKDLITGIVIFAIAGEYLAVVFRGGDVVEGMEALLETSAS